MPWSRLTLLRAHRVEAGLLLIIEQIVEPGERRTHALRRNEHRLETLCHRVEPPNRCQRRVRWAGVPQVLGRFRGGVPEFVQGLALPLIGADLLIDRPMYQAGLAGLAYLRRGAVSLLNADVGPNVSAPNVPSFRNIDAGVSV